MLELNKYSIFYDNLTTLKEASKDEHGVAAGDIAYLTESDLPVVNFDRVKDCYIHALSINGDVPKSNDALFIAGEDIAFIEFKNGLLSSREQFGLGRKIYDSLLILFDITGLTLSVSRAKMDYILVYNERKNPKDEDGQRPEAASKNIISSILMKKGGAHYIRFGLERFEKYCFRNVYTYSKEEFEDFLKHTPRTDI